MLNQQPETQKPEVYVCMGTACQNNFSKDTLNHAQKLVRKKEISTAETQTCLGHCQKGPNIIIKKSDQSDQIHENITPTALDKLLKN